MEFNTTPLANASSPVKLPAVLAKLSSEPFAMIVSNSGSMTFPESKSAGKTPTFSLDQVKQLISTVVDAVVKLMSGNQTSAATPATTPTDANSATGATSSTSTTDATTATPATQTPAPAADDLQSKIKSFAEMATSLATEITSLVTGLKTIMSGAKAVGELFKGATKALKSIFGGGLKSLLGGAKDGGLASTLTDAASGGLASTAKKALSSVVKF